MEARPGPALTSPSAIHIQLGLFGPAEVVGMHVVSAHSRTLDDGSEVFVGEHVRWNRGRQHRPTPPPPERRATPPTEDVEEIPDAGQLRLWSGP